MSSTELTFEIDAASAEDIEAHLTRCDDSFDPRLSSRVGLTAYAEKIRRHGVTFEAWDGGTLVGLVAGYFNDTRRREGFITSVSVEKAWGRRRVATALLRTSLEWARAHEYPAVRLEVGRENAAAIRLYESVDFRVAEPGADPLVMVCAGPESRSAGPAPEPGGTP